MKFCIENFEKHDRQAVCLPDTTLPRSSARKIENEDEGESENDAFASKYCVRICIPRKCRSTIYTLITLASAVTSILH